MGQEQSEIENLRGAVANLQSEVFLLRASLMKLASLTVTSLAIDSPTASHDTKSEAFAKMSRLLKLVDSVATAERKIGEPPTTIEVWHDD